MRIAQVTSLIESVPPLHNNGLEFIVHFLTEGLVRRGHQVTLFATADSRTEAALISLWPMAISRDPRASGIARETFSKWSHESAYCMSNQFDIIHTHDFSGMFWGLLPCPLAVTVHGARYIFTNKRLPKKYECYLKQQEAKFRDGYVIFVSKSQRREFPRGKRHFVVHNGVPTQDFTFNSKPGDYFAFLGYISQEKGPHLAVQAALKAGVTLKVAGPMFGEINERYFRQEIEPYVDGEQIEYLGSLGYAAKIKFLQKAKAVFIPIQWEEPFGLVMIEAMSCGTPVIALNRAAVPEIVVDGKTGFICKNVSEMAKAVRKIDQINRCDCRRHVEAKFSVEKMVEGYERVYEEIIEDFKKRFG